MPRVHFSVPGVPQGRRDPKARGFMANRGGKMIAVAQTYKDPRDRPWQYGVRATAMPLFDKPIPAGVPVRFSLVAYFPLPSSRCRKRVPRAQERHMSKPDTSNIVKGVEDALKGVAWIDDSQTYLGPCEKFVCAQIDNRPRTEVVIEWDDDGDQDLTRTVDFGPGPVLSGDRQDGQARYLF